MAINVRRGRSSTTASDGGAETMPIGGDASPDVFACPTCSRPLAVGTSRCRGCGTVLIVGVPARRASLFIAVGAVIGLMAGAAMATVASDASRVSAGATAVPIAPAATSAPVVSAGAGTSAGATGGGSPVNSAVPIAAASALRLTITVDDRLAASAGSLRLALRGKFDPVDAAATLRLMAGDAAWGTDVVGRLSDWPAAAGLQADLRAHYAAVAATARDGLGATITSASAYRAAAQQMTDLLGRPTDLRAKSVALAAANAISLPQP